MLDPFNLLDILYRADELCDYLGLAMAWKDLGLELVDEVLEDRLSWLQLLLNSYVVEQEQVLEELHDLLPGSLDVDWLQLQRGARSLGFLLLAVFVA